MCVPVAHVAVSGNRVGQSAGGGLGKPAKEGQKRGGCGGAGGTNRQALAEGEQYFPSPRKSTLITFVSF